MTGMKTRRLQITEMSKAWPNVQTSRTIFVAIHQALDHHANGETEKGRDEVHVCVSLLQAL